MRQVTRRRPSTFLLAVIATASVIAISYTVLSVGLLDTGYAAITRLGSLADLKKAERADPPDVEAVVSAIFSPDWVVAAEGAETAGRLAKVGTLTLSERERLLSALFAMLSSGGHWWRLGWDRDEAEYDQFVGSATSAMARYGLQAYPYILSGLRSGSARTRETACWIALNVFQNRSPLPETARDELRVEVQEHANTDSDQIVRNACERALNASPGESSRR
jgi:hypothetical protein